MFQPRVGSALSERIWPSNGDERRFFWISGFFPSNSSSSSSTMSLVTGTARPLGLVNTRTVSSSCERGGDVPFCVPIIHELRKGVRLKHPSLGRGQNCSARGVDLQVKVEGEVADVPRSSAVVAAVPGESIQVYYSLPLWWVQPLSPACAWSMPLQVSVAVYPMICSGGVSGLGVSAGVVCTVGNPRSVTETDEDAPLATTTVVAMLTRHRTTRAAVSTGGGGRCCSPHAGLSSSPCDRVVHI